MARVDLEIPTPRWALPLLPPSRYKGAKGGRSSGKSHHFAESAVEEMVVDPTLRFVCIREVQRSLKFSAKSLIEHKIRHMGVSHLFDPLSTEIRRRGGTGVMIFEGMQDHTADSLKSLEGFGRAWVEEAQNLSQRSLDLLLPTIRADGSEIWFSWNPESPTDPVDKFLVQDRPTNAQVVHVNWQDNPFCPQTARDEALRMRRLDPDTYDHIWLGGYNTRSNARVLAGRWREDQFEPSPAWDGPYFGDDWGFSNDPLAISKCWIGDNRLWIEYEAGGVGIGLDDIPDVFETIPGATEHTHRSDPSRPETIAYLRGKGLKVEAAPSWSGSVKDGVEFLRKFEEIVIHSRCRNTLEEARLWSYKTDRLTGDPLPTLAPGHDHWWDSVRYALSPLIFQSQKKRVRFR
jgi:phage terminase large subunit